MNVHHSVSHSRKTNGWNLKCTQFWKGKSSSKPPFVGSMSVYRSVCQPLLDSCIATTLTEGHSWFLSWVEQPLRPGHFVLGRWIPTFQQKLSQKVYPLGDAIFFCKTTQSWKFTMNYKIGTWCSVSDSVTSRTSSNKKHNRKRCVSFLLRQFLGGFFFQHTWKHPNLNRNSIVLLKNHHSLLCFECILRKVVVKFDEIRR